MFIHLGGEKRCQDWSGKWNRTSFPQSSLGKANPSWRERASAYSPGRNSLVTAVKPCLRMATSDA
jgi:hypothetical protein